ncbi:uncharacterized protein LOC142632703 [Castanea sativa]|uniref:uncharacterized protein LOC142632703 n=1 Tax=Castanea sativa TaxID=21020 RepID=UPI003F653576
MSSSQASFPRWCELTTPSLARHLHHPYDDALVVSIQLTKDVTFLVVNYSSAYNAILGRPTLNLWKTLTSTYHLMIKFPTEYGVGELRGDQVAARECYIAMLEMDDPLQVMNVEEHRVVAEPIERLEEIHLDNSRPDRTTRIGTFASSPVRQALINFLQENQDKKRVFAQEWDRAIAEEVCKLQDTNFIREVYYPDWLANVVMVKKANEKWRICVDFTDLNKACPKDSYSLPRIDILVDFTACHQLLSFMDAFSSYNQIKLNKDEADQEKTSQAKG